MSESKKYIHIVGTVVVMGVAYAGVSFVEGITTELEPKPCEEGQQRLVFKDGDRRLARINVSAIGDVQTSDETIEGFLVLTPEDLGEDAPPADTNQ